MSDKVLFYGFVLVGLYLVLTHAGVIPNVVNAAGGQVQGLTQTLQGR